MTMSLISVTLTDGTTRALTTVTREGDASDALAIAEQAKDETAAENNANYLITDITVDGKRHEDSE